VGDLKERLADAEAEVLVLDEHLGEEKSRVEELQGKLRSAQQALDEGARQRCYLGNDLVLGHLHKHTLYHQPFSAEATNGMREGTPTVLHMQAEPVQTSNHERGRGRDTERPRVSSSRARSSPSLRSHMTDQPQPEQRNRIFQDMDLFRPDKYNQLIQDINQFLKPEADEGGGRCARVHGVRSGADKASRERFARKSSNYLGNDLVLAQGQLGLNSREHQRQPARVGAIWTCGHGADGQGDAQHRLQPTRLGPEAFGGSPGVLVACGLYQVGEERAKLARR